MSKVNEKEKNETSPEFQYLEKLFSYKSYALRGIVFGIFQVLGATIGIALLFFLVREVFNGLDRISGVNLLTDSGVAKIVREEAEKYTE